MQIVDLVGGDRRSPEESQSYMRKSPLLRRSSCPILSLHHAVVRRGTAKRDAISLIVCACPRKGAAPGDVTFEMVDVRRLEIRACRLIVTAILIQPRNRIRISTAIGSRDLLLAE